MERKARNKYIEYAGDRCICVQPAAVETFVFHREWWHRSSDSQAQLLQEELDGRMREAQSLALKATLKDGIFPWECHGI